MKRAGNLFDAVVDRDNLRLAFYQASRGKRARPEVRDFADHFEERLAEMAARLHAGTIPAGQFRQFVIHDPKERVITAPCFPERVLHHALMNVGEPHLDRWLIADTFACTGAVQAGRPHYGNRVAGWHWLGCGPSPPGRGTSWPTGGWALLRNSFFAVRLGNVP